jgi:hypothetical protein
MREMNGVVSLNPFTLGIVKRYALILDKFHLTDLEKELSWHLLDSIKADLQFLQERYRVVAASQVCTDEANSRNGNADEALSFSGGRRRFRCSLRG